MSRKIHKVDCSKANALNLVYTITQAVNNLNIYFRLAWQYFSVVWTALPTCILSVSMRQQTRWVSLWDWKRCPLQPCSPSYWNPQFVRLSAAAASGSQASIFERCVCLSISVRYRDWHCLCCAQHPSKHPLFKPATAQSQHTHGPTNNAKRQGGQIFNKQ